jgi:hypothetical protein
MANKNNKYLPLFQLVIVGCCLLSLFVELSMGASQFNPAVSFLAFDYK